MQTVAAAFCLFTELYHKIQYRLSVCKTFLVKHELRVDDVATIKNSLLIFNPEPNNSHMWPFVFQVDAVNYWNVYQKTLHLNTLISFPPLKHRL